MNEDYRQIFYFELVPGRFVCINMKGPFDSDMWHVLNDFIKRHETHPVAVTTSLLREPSQHAPLVTNENLY